MLCRVEPDMVSLITGLLGPLLLAQVPRLGHQRAALDRLELVAPDAAAEHRAERTARRGLPRDAPVLVELDHRVAGGVGDPEVHVHAEPVAEGEPPTAAAGARDRAATVDLRVARPGRPAGRRSARAVPGPAAARR